MHHKVAVGRSTWLFAGSLRAGKRASAIMSLLRSARIKRHNSYAYFKDVLDRLPTHPASRIDELLSISQSDIKVEAEIDLGSRLTTNSPVVQWRLVQHDDDVGGFNAQRAEAAHDALI